MKKRKIIVSLFALLGLVSCWEDVEVELDLGEPQLAVSDIGLAVGEKIRIAISPDPVVNWDSVQPFYEQTHARLWVNGREETLHLRLIEDSLQMNPYNPYYNCFFESDCIAREGDQIRIEANHEGYAPIVAENTVPSVVPIESLEYSCSLDTLRSYWPVDIRLTFRDQPGKTNYYGLTVCQWLGEKDIFPSSGYGYGTGGYGYIYADEEGRFCCYGNLDTSNEPIIKFRPGTVDYILDETYDMYADFFDDSEIDGESYTLRLSYSSLCSEIQWYVLDSTGFFHYLDTTIVLDSLYLQIDLISLSQDDYYRNISNWAARGFLSESFAEIGLTDPTQVYSNVKGGTGLLSARNISRHIIRLKNPKSEPEPDVFPERVD